MEPTKNSWDESIKTVFYAIVLALVFRSFAYEPFHIPSGSMESNLLVGDYLFVSKYSYGYSRYSFPFGFPLFSGRILAGAPKRGDVIVFRLPRMPRIDYIKRVMGLPGDRIGYYDNQVHINGEPIGYESLGTYQGHDSGIGMTGAEELREQLAGRAHLVLERTGLPYRDPGEGEWVVPPGHYFVMGDNRDNSEDSRYWGFLPEENLRGKAFLIWMNIDGGIDFSRIGKSIQ